MENSDDTGIISQINDVLDFLKDLRTRKSALELLLGFTDTEEMRKHFLKTDIAKIMIRQLENEDSKDRDLVLQIIINLSSEEKFQKIFLALNSSFRICELLFKKIERDMKKEKESEDVFDISKYFKTDGGIDFKNQTTEKIDIKYGKIIILIKILKKLVLEKYIVNFDKKTQNQTDTNLFLNEIPYYFMILTNLTLAEDGQKKFINLENENIKGIVLMKTLDKFFEYIYNEEFNFCSSILANISSLKEGRQMILEFKIFKIFLIHMDRLNNFKITNILRLIRNCAFEFETFKDELLVNDAKLFSLLIKILILANVSDKKLIGDTGIKHIDEIYFTHFNQEIAYSEKEVINDLIVDIFLTLTNDEEAITLMKEKGLHRAISYVKNNIGKNENLNDRLFVINNYLEN